MLSAQRLNEGLGAQSAARPTTRHWLSKATGCRLITGKYLWTSACPDLCILIKHGSYQTELSERSPGLYKTFLRCLFIAVSLQHCQSQLTLLQHVSVPWLQSKHGAKNTALLGKKKHTQGGTLLPFFFFSIFLPGSLNLKLSHEYLYDVYANHVNGFA